MLWANPADDKLIIFFLFSWKKGSDTSCKILFSRENKKSKCRLLKILPSMQNVILFSANTNLARGRPTFASSIFNGATSGRAVDGLFYASGHAYENCYASEYEESPWWMLHLEREYKILGVLILACGEILYLENCILHTTVLS